MLHYSRDEQAGPLRELQRVYDAIIADDFRPDQTRSGYVRRVRRNEARPAVQIHRDAEDLSETDTSGSDGGGSESENDASLQKFDAMVPSAAPGSVPSEDGEFEGRKPAKDASALIFEHVLWKTLHKGSGKSILHLACGRAIGPAFRESELSNSKPRCGTCFGARE